MGGNKTPSTAARRRYAIRAHAEGLHHTSHAGLPWKACQSEKEQLTSKLAAAWLDELKLLHHIKDNLTLAERRRLIAKAEAAATTVTAKFDAMARSGEMKPHTQAYKAYRATAPRAVGWQAYCHRIKLAMVRAMAREQRDRARRGIL